MSTSSHRVPLDLNGVPSANGSEIVYVSLMVFAFTSDIVSLTNNGSKACHEGRSEILTG